MYQNFVISLEGPMGAGKTTAAVAMGVDDCLENLAIGKKLVSNVELHNLPSNIPYKHYDLKWLVEHFTSAELDNANVIIDEGYQINDSLSSTSKLNRLIAIWVAQTRKAQTDMYWCTHYLDYLHYRTRRMVNIRCSCDYIEEKCRRCRGEGHRKMVPCEECLGYGIMAYVWIKVLDRRRRVVRRRYQLDPIFANMYWKYFDTSQKIPIMARILAGIDTEEAVYVT